MFLHYLKRVISCISLYRVFFQNVEAMVKVTSSVFSHAITNDDKVGMARNALSARRRNPDLESVSKFNFY